MDFKAFFGTTVVPLGTGYTAMQNAIVQQMRAYWEALRPPGDLPRRDQIDPRGIESALEYALLVERVAPGIARIRLGGMHLNDLMGMEVRGMPLSALTEPDARQPLADALEQVFAGPALADLSVSAARALGRPALRGRLVLYPIRSDNGRIDRALGALVMEGDFGRPPRRLSIDAVRMERVVLAPVATVQDRPAPVPGFAEPAATFAPARHAPRPYLRLVKTDTAQD